MKLKALIATAVASAAILVPVASASATTYHVWTPQYAANEVADSTLYWTDDSPDHVTYAACRGIGRAHYFYGEAHFHKLNCYIETADSESYVIRVIPTGSHDFQFRFLRWA